ncbi:DivIVA domain-containing protein [Corynebacterium bovis]|uniref:DivIVA domain-containing protein n=3 Tax=Corynebacterium bovis TaxID=36808 RepID=UPI001C8AD736|nr:DivIVA domain-containing protein [Corynebacterium bovis]
MYWLMSLFGALAVGCVLVYLVGTVTGRQETLPDLTTGPDAEEHWRELTRTPVTAESVRGARFSLAFRGYRAAEVDALLERVAATLAEREPAATGAATGAATDGAGGAAADGTDVSTDATADATARSAAVPASGVDDPAPSPGVRP